MDHNVVLTPQFGGGFMAGIVLCFILLIVFDMGRKL